MAKNIIYRAENFDDNSRPKKRMKHDLLYEPDIEPYLECCVCMRSDMDGLAVVVDNEKPVEDTGIHPMATLRDCDEGIPLENTIFLSCCGVHGVCYDCLHKLAMNFDNHPIGPKHPLIRCPYPFNDGCITSTGVPNYFTHLDIKKILSESDYVLYMNHADRYQFPGYEIVKCPRPTIDNENQEIVSCGALILVPIDVLHDTQVGQLILECNQNPQCYRRTCYHCHSLIRKRGITEHEHEDEDQIGGYIVDKDVYCERCVTNVENTNPKSFNRYFYNPNKKIKDGNPLLFRNDELEDDLIISQIEEIIDAEELYTKCMECLTPIHKTEQCNTMTHCGIERCYACGRSGTYQQPLGDHWDVSGITGCPRFDYSTFWNEWAGCDFKCLETECYGDSIGSCNIDDHQEGINRVNEIRKRSHVYHAIKSLLPEQQDRIMKHLSNLTKFQPYLPTVKCSEYKTYLPDIIVKKIDEVKEMIDEEGDQPQCRDFLNRLSFLNFERI